MKNKDLQVAALKEGSVIEKDGKYLYKYSDGKKTEYRPLAEDQKIIVKKDEPKLEEKEELIQIISDEALHTLEPNEEIETIDVCEISEDEREGCPVHLRFR